MTQQRQSTALVTGATGFIGARLVQRLLDQDWSVRVLVRDGGRLPAALAGRCSMLTGSLSDLDVLAQAVSGADVVFHCAANTSSWDTRAAYRRDNVHGVCNLLGALCQASGHAPRLVHLSSADVYGFPSQPASEESPLAVPACGFAYADSKRRGEDLVRSLCEARKIPWTVLRPVHVIGPGSPWLNQLGATLATGMRLSVDGGRVHAGLLDVENLIDVLIWAATADCAIAQIYNVRDPHEATWADFLTRFAPAIDAHAWTLDLPFSLADLAARLVEMGCQAVLPHRAPPLRREQVRILGRTGGHPIARLQAAGAPLGRVGFEESVSRAAEGFLRQARSAPGFAARGTPLSGGTAPGA